MEGARTAAAAERAAVVARARAEEAREKARAEPLMMLM